jgi:mRNA-degrading endonuclease RelE of RelBE toxin-antitoxin system
MKVFNFKTTPEFNKSYKKLSKRYINIYNDFNKLKDTLQKNPKDGESLGNGLYKIRVKNSDKNKGKNAGYRIITYLIDNENTINFIYIYDKSDIENIPIKELSTIITRNFN